ncbi:MAG: dihydrolipoyl dehydrogenase [Candidatus Helarchaeota archaeon]|nr:dihydrolipoyl dehydrogenase [Candidatus Helarchaeota archaeon]
MNDKIYDIAIIGAGPGGYHAAIRAAQYDAIVALIEKDKVGGTCLNRGCIPTKTLYSAAKLIEDINEKSNEFGVDLDGEIKPNFKKAVDRKNKVVDELVEGVKALVKQRKVDLFSGHGSIIGGSIDTGFDVKIEGEYIKQIIAKRVIIATGSSPALIPAFNIDHARILTSDDILSSDFKEVPETLLIIGGGVIGCEFANIFSRFGSKIIILEYLPTILATEEKLIVRELKKKFKKMGIEIYENQNVLKVENTESRVIATTCDARVPRDQIDSAEKIKYNANLCLISIGRARSTKGLGLENTKIRVERGSIKVNPKTLETAEKGIYAIGDVTGGLMLAHIASYEGDIAVYNALYSIGGFDTVPHEADYSVVPASIFTSPEIGSVGLREKSLKDRGTKIRTGRFGYAALGKAKCMGEEEGFLMIITDEKTGTILGASCIGVEAPELIAEIALAMKYGLRVQELGETIHSHPTVSEMVLEAAEDVHGLAIHRARRRVKLEVEKHEDIYQKFKESKRILELLYKRTLA